MPRTGSCRRTQTLAFQTVAAVKAAIITRGDTFMFSAGEKLKSSKINCFGLRPKLPWWVQASPTARKCQSNLTMVFLTHAETQVLQTLAAYNCRISEKNGRTGVSGFDLLLDRLELLDSISVSYTSVHRVALEKRIMSPPQFLAAIAEQSAARINDIYCSSESASSRIGSFSCGLKRLSCALQRRRACSGRLHRPAKNEKKEPSAEENLWKNENEKNVILRKEVKEPAKVLERSACDST